MTRHLAGAIALVTGMFAGEVHGMGVMPDCLDTLSADTQRWSECTQAFSRQDSRCKLRAARMSESMQRCDEKGYSKPEIDAAMARGAASASAYSKHDSDTLPGTPAPRPERGPVPGFRKPEGN